jgi:hypothetical protein
MNSFKRRTLAAAALMALATAALSQSNPTERSGQPHRFGQPVRTCAAGLLYSCSVQCDAPEPNPLARFPRPTSMICVVSECRCEAPRFQATPGSNAATIAAESDQPLALMALDLEQLLP